MVVCMRYGLSTSCFLFTIHKLLNSCVCSKFLMRDAPPERSMMTCPCSGHSESATLRFSIDLLLSEAPYCKKQAAGVKLDESGNYSQCDHTCMYAPVLPASASFKVQTAPPSGLPQCFHFRDLLDASTFLQLTTTSTLSPCTAS